MSVFDNTLRYSVVIKHNIKAFRCPAYGDRAIERLDALINPKRTTLNVCM